MTLCLGGAGGGSVLVRGRDGRGSGACFGGGAHNLGTRGSNAMRYVDHALSNGRHSTYRRPMEGVREAHPVLEGKKIGPTREDSQSARHALLVGISYSGRLW